MVVLSASYMYLLGKQRFMILHCVVIVWKIMLLLVVLLV